MGSLSSGPDGPARSAVRQSLLLITEGFDRDTAARVRDAIAALPAGFAMVQLRAKRLDGAALFAAAQELRDVLAVAMRKLRDATAVSGGPGASQGAALVVNDRLDVALAAGADGVHLPSRGLPVATARALVGGARLVDGAPLGGGARLVGVSTHSVAEAVAARRDGADYVVFGPVWPTGQKRDAVGLDALAAAVRACAPMPVFALGGVDAARAPAVVATGARVACLGAVLGRADAGAAARALAAAMG